MTDKCGDLATIPQYSGTCWFNVVLAILLYSSRLKKELIKVADKWENNNFNKLLKLVLKKNKKENREEMMRLYQTFKPDLFLYRYMVINKNKSYTYEIFKSKFENWDEIGFFEAIFLIEFRRYLGLNSLYICLDNNNNQILADAFESFYKAFYTIENWSDVYIGIKNLYLKDQSINDRKEEIKKELNLIPDVIIINTNQLYKGFNDSYISSIDDIINLYKLNDKIGFIDDKGEIKNEFNYKGITYQLDSCSLTNFNKEELRAGHVIAGITCDNKKYVYNGWTTQTFDKGIVNIDESSSNETKYPCNLMPFNWDINKSKDFCLNPSTCKLSKVSRGELCFNFGKADRTIFYVKKKSNDIPDIPNIPYDFDMNEIKNEIKDLYRIDLMSRKILERVLIRNKFFEFQGKTDDELRNIVINLIFKAYLLDEPFQLNVPPELSNVDICKQFLLKLDELLN